MGGAGDPVRSLETVGSAYSWVMSRLIPPRADASRIRTRNAAQVMAALRDTATNLARLDGYDDIAAAQRAAAWHPTAISEVFSTDWAFGVGQDERGLDDGADSLRAQPDAVQRLPASLEQRDTAFALGA
jgi:hypothetical protein